MTTQQKQTKLTDNPVVIIIGVIAAIVAIIAFASGKTTLADLLNFNPSPSQVARTWVQHLAANDCQSAGKMLAPGYERFINRSCGAIMAIKKIDQVYEQDGIMGTKVVVMAGSFTSSMGCETDNLSVNLEQIEGKWYPIDIVMGWCN